MFWQMFPNGANMSKGLLVAASLSTSQQLPGAEHLATAGARPPLAVVLA
jgi:hypothetical protein